MVNSFYIKKSQVLRIFYTDILINTCSHQIRCTTEQQRTQVRRGSLPAMVTTKVLKLQEAI